MLGVLVGSFSVYDTMTHFIVISRVACAAANAVEYCFWGGGRRGGVLLLLLLLRNSGASQGLVCWSPLS